MCPSGEKVISGGFDDDSGEVFLNEANSDRTGWTVLLDNSGGSSSATLNIYAYCSGAGKAVTARVESRKLQPPRSHAARLLERRLALHH
jgi:hypothetical protein